MINNYLIAICDIMGFANQIRSYKLSDILNISFSDLKKTLQHSIYKNGFPENIPSIKELREQNEIGFAWFSDTILFYTFEDTDKNCAKLIETVGWLLFENMHNPYTRLRSAISYGEAYINQDEDFYLGKAILEAIELEKDQEWSGGAFTEDAEKRVSQYLKDNSAFSWLTYYDVPLKSCGFKHQLAIDWTRGFHSFEEMKWSKTNSVPTNDDLIKRPDIVKKWRNTKKFHDEVCQYCRKKN